MKNKIFLSAILLLIFYSSNAQSWDWAKNISNGAKNIGTSIGTDNQNNIYVKGSTSYSTGGGGGYYYSMFWKFDNSGNLLWADTLDLGGKSVTDTNGYTYIASGKIARYENTGIKMWEVSAPMGIVYRNIALHSSGGVVVVGDVLIGNDTKSVLSYYDGNGICLWTKIGEFPLGGVLNCDEYGNSYIAGSGYTDSITGNCGFLVKYNSSGVLLSNRVIPHFPNDIAIDNRNNIYVTGWFAPNWPININNVIYHANYPSNPQPQYLIKYDQSGNVLWYKVITGEIGRDAIATDKEGNVYLTIGYSSLQVDNFSLNGGGIAVIKIDSLGNILWMEQSLTISPGSNYPNDIIVNSANEVHITGAMSGSHSFGAYTLTQSSMYTDLLIAKIGLGITTNITPPKPIHLKEFNVFPNPGQGMFQIFYKASETEEIQINVFNSSGIKVYSEKTASTQKDFTKNINLSKEAKGTYYIELITDGKKSVKKVVLN